MKKLCVFLLYLVICHAVSAEENRIKAVLFPFRETVLSSRVDTKVISYCFRIGEQFKKNDVIAVLDSTDCELRLKQKKEQMDFAKVVFLDKKELKEKNFTSGFELKKAEFEFKMAENAWHEARLMLERCTLKAPFAGKTVEFLSKEHEAVRAGQQLIKIIDDSNLLAVINIPAKEISADRKNIILKLDNGKVVNGRIYEISPQIDHRTGTLRIRVLIDNKDGKIHAGATGTLLNIQ